MAANPSILLIDDSPGECELFRMALTQAGLAVSLHTETDGQAAFQFLTQSSGIESPPSLILLKLGNQHGLDFLRRLRLDARVKHVPVVVVFFTTSDDPADLTACTACYVAGANGYVIKPGTYEDLIRFINDLCRYWIEWNRAPSFAETRC
jgi:two-component system, chemotaxis family, response regulator Rcp1